jgi:hypothetical protein
MSGEKNPFYGKTHTDEVKTLISKSSSFHQSAEKNSQYGTMWITNGITNKKIKKDDIIPEGWEKGTYVSYHNKRKKQKQKEENLKERLLLKENKIKQISKLYEIYIVDGFDGVKNIGYKYSCANLIQSFKKYIPEFVPRNGTK